MVRLWGHYSNIKCLTNFVEIGAFVQTLKGNAHIFDKPLYVP